MLELWTVVHRVKAGLRRGNTLGAGPLDAALGVLDADSPAAPAVSPRAHDRARTALAGLIGDTGLAAVEQARRADGREVLVPYRMVLAADRLDPPGVEGRETLLKAVTGGPPTRTAYLLSMLATGRGPEAVAGLATLVAAHAKDNNWLHRHLGVLGGVPGPATFVDDDGAALRLRQLGPTTCGPTCAILLRMLLDPAYALWLTTGDHLEPERSGDGLPFEQRFRSQQHAVHEALTRRALGPAPWPRALGSPPWALAAFLNRFTGLTGAQFGWVPVDGDNPVQLRRCLDAVLRGVSAGVPVPVYIGRTVDRHVVLAIGSRGEAVVVYDPAAGAIVDVPLADWEAGRVGIAGWDHLESVVVPRLLAHQEFR
ncbi:hypothetical protein [Sporichthya sp.]|uniref:hypothetical protein n=1 Tax=Sporichthya sp. TaxID=65475 RepID=UPI0017F48DD4|nr:hypothetical protein [Sporichthya sp.]MBA3745729.1 hypothetical protein [Sporichthya sp.]